MVDVAQLVESRIVIPVVVGSSPIIHPKSGPLAQLVEQETLNLLVESSSLSGPTNSNPLHGGFFYADMPYKLSGGHIFNLAESPFYQEFTTIMLQ